MNYNYNCIILNIYNSCYARSSLVKEIRLLPVRIYCIIERYKYKLCPWSLLVFVGACPLSPGSSKTTFVLGGIEMTCVSIRNSARLHEHAYIFNQV